jgi:predicted O-linked N-acetylglucosamine transferase (SPINDLY family)
MAEKEMTHSEGDVALPETERRWLIGQFNAGHHAELEKRARELTECHPDAAFAWMMLGLSLHVQGKDGLSALRRAAALSPEDAEMHNNLGNALRDRGMPEDSAQSCRRALAINPDFASAHYNLGNALAELGQVEAAVASFRRALEIEPGFALAHYNLGNQMRILGHLDEAIKSYRHALEITPDFALAHNNLGNVLRDVGQYDAAASSYLRMVELQPDAAMGYSNLGNVLRELGRFEESAENCRRALELKPDFAEAWSNLGVAQQDLGMLDEAIGSFRKALEVDGEFRIAHSNLLFALNYHPQKSGEEIYSAYREYDERYGQPHRKSWRAHGNPKEPGKRLKIGYVSPDFRQHSCRYFLEPLLSKHDKGQVEVTAYAELLGEDPVTRRYKDYVEHWVVTSGLTDDALAERIRADGIDILIDLAGHTDKNRLGVFARKPAPIQISWLGYGTTTGLSAIDYLLTDATSAPEGSEGLFSEQPWRIETPCYAYRPAEGIGEINPLPALRKGHLTYGTLTRAIRINDRVIRVWSEILKRVESAHLIIDSADYRESGMQERLKAKFAAHGIAPERLEIGYHSPPWDTLRSIDIGLDCFPHNSGTTLFETLYMGIPYITLAGRPSVGRLGSSILHGVGHPEWIAETEEFYIEKAVQLASDTDKLSVLRSGLRREMARSALLDEAGFARKVETAYRRMWEKWCAAEDCAMEASPFRREARVAEPDHGAAAQETAGQETAEERSQLFNLFNAGRYGEMESLARRLIERYPESGLAWKGLSVALQAQGQEALAELRRTVELLPEDADAHNNLGNALRNAGRFEAAQASYRRALEINPDFADAYNNLGNVLKDLGRLDDALASYRHALELNPLFADAHNNLGSVLKDLGQFDAALANYRKALELNPDFAAAYNNLGNAQTCIGHLDEALANCRRALELAPGYAAAHYNLGNALREAGQYDEALSSYGKALEIRPDYAEAYTNQGNVLKDLGRLDEAAASYRRALEINPCFAEAHNNLGNALKDLGHVDEAMASYRLALKFNPAFAEVYSNLLFSLNYYSGLHDKEIFSVGREYDRRFMIWDGGRHPNDGDPERRLRIGYVSPDFRRHAVAYFAEPILARHDRTRVEIYCYAEVQREDDYTERFRRLSDHWHSTVGLSDEAVEKLIREHRIDILVDLAGHTRGNRLPLFGRKPAPVQITYLGFAGSSGLSAMDYRLTDRYADPEGTEGRYTEKLLRLPYSLWCYRPGPDMPDVTALPTQKRGYLTFGSFNNFNKLDQETMDLWAALLRAIADSRLMMLTVPEGEARQRLLKEFAARGIDAQRLELHGSLPMDAFHRKFLEADIALDPVNVNGGTTTCEALWMGLPVLSLTGKRFLSRAGLSILSTVGMADFAAATPEAYLQVASYLNENRDLLVEIRANLRGFVAASPLTDETGFTRALEGVYRQVWREWCAAA